MRIESTSRGRAALALVVLAAAGAWMAPATASAAGRVALVVGNGAYGAIGTLPNPGNDAADVASALGRIAAGGDPGRVPEQPVRRRRLP